MQNVLSLLVLISISASSVFAFGFQDNSANKMSVGNALRMSHNSYVTVEGNIVKKLSDDKYMFKDATGTITVEIDSDKWNGLTVSSQDKLELSGEIEKKISSTILDVDNIKKIENAIKK